MPYNRLFADDGRVRDLALGVRARLLAQDQSITDRFGVQQQVLDGFGERVARVERNQVVVNVRQYGDSEAAIRQAVAEMPAGGTLYLPKGTYKRPWGSGVTNAAYIPIDKPMSIVGEPGTVLENYLFYIRGTFESPIPLTSALVEGSRGITCNHGGWVEGDVVQLLSHYNTYSSAAGDFQLGSVNPTTNTTLNCQTGEMHEVGSVAASTVQLKTLTYFGGYTTASRIRRIRTVDGVLFQGITFRNVNPSYRGILARGARDLTFQDCWFESGENAGASVRLYDCLRTKFIGGGVKKLRSTSSSGSSWNTIVPGGGCTDTEFRGVYFTGGHQPLDFTCLAGAFASDPGATLGEARTQQNMKVIGCTFHDCHDAFTTHPGTMGFTAIGNIVHGGSSGMRVRSRRNTIVANTIRTSRAGIALSAFVDDTTIVGNDLSGVASPAYDSYYTGIHYTPLSSESDNGNQVKNLIVKNNTITVNAGYPYSACVRMMYSNIADYPVSDAWKNRTSSITIDGNTFCDGGVVLDDGINFVTVTNNTFVGKHESAHALTVLGFAAMISGNRFGSGTANIRCLNTEHGTMPTYNVKHVVGGNLSRYPATGNQIADNRPMLMESGGAQGI